MERGKEETGTKSEQILPVLSWYVDEQHSSKEMNAFDEYDANAFQSHLPHLPGTSV